MPKGDGGRERRMVPDVAPTSYYGRPVLKAPTWKWPIPAYFFTGGLAAGTTLVGAGARLTGDRRLAGRSGAATLGLVGVSSVFLIHDLGRPSRFHHMLRVIKPTSPMSVGTWIFSAFATLVGTSVAAEVGEKVGVLPARLARPLAAGAQVGAALVAPALATYTAVLVGDTAVPAWHEAHRHLPWLFAGSAASAGGGAGVLLSVVGHGGTIAPGARRLALVGAAGKLAADRSMHRHLETVATGDTDTPNLGTAFALGLPRQLTLAARATTVAGAAGIAIAGRRRQPVARGVVPAGRGDSALAVVAAVLLMAGSALERFAVFHAGKVSAADPVYTVGPQRAGLVRAGAQT